MREENPQTGSNVAQQIAENGTSRASCAPAPVHKAVTPFTVLMKLLLVKEKNNYAVLRIYSQPYAQKLCPYMIIHSATAHLFKNYSNS